MFPFTLHQLRILNTIAIQQSLIKAALKLHLSQPLLSKYLITLEVNLGLKLLNRKTNKIVLTKNGEIFLNYSERILALCEETCRALAKSEKGNEKKLRVGITKTIPVSLFSKLLEFCSQLKFQLDLHFFVGSTTKIVKQIINKKLDLAIINIDSYQFLTPGLKIEVGYYTTNFTNLVISKSHPTTKKDSLNKQEFYNLNCIVSNLTNSQRDSLNKLLKTNQIDLYQFNTLIRVNSIENIKTATQLGLGTSFNLSFSFAKELQLIRLPKTEVRQNICVINNKSSKSSKAFKLFGKELKKCKKTLIKPIVK